MNDELDLEALDAYLMSDDSPEGSMMLSDLDGFLHGIICSPVPIPQDEWMTRALGDTPDNLPKWVVNNVSQLHQEIADGLAAAPPVVEPMFWQAAEGHVIAMDWCEGFLDAVAQRPQEWIRLTESETHGHLFTPIMAHLLDNDGNSVLEIPKDMLPKVLDEAVKVIPDSVVGLYDFWNVDPEGKLLH